MNNDATDWKKTIDDLLIRQHKFRDSRYCAQELAADLGISTSRLSRILRSTYGQTYTDIVMALRMKRARRHLADPAKNSMTVEEIGVLSGFGNKQTFFATFKRITGVTPADYRKTAQQHNSHTV